MPIKIIAYFYDHLIMMPGFEMGKMNIRMRNIFIMFWLLLASLVFTQSCTKNNSNGSGCVVCANGGVCIGKVCTCSIGYEGSDCTTLSATKFLGSWNVTEKGTNSDTSKYGLAIQSIPGSANKVLIRNFYNFFTLDVSGTIVADTLYIPVQQLDGKIVIGTGYISVGSSSQTDGQVSVRYEVIDTATQTINSFHYAEGDLSAASKWKR